MPWGMNRCQQIRSFDEPMAKMLDANDIVFAVHLPLPNHEMSPWFQYMLAVLQFDIAFKMINQIGETGFMYVREFAASLLFLQVCILSLFMQRMMLPSLLMLVWDTGMMCGRSGLHNLTLSSKGHLVVHLESLR